MSTAALFQLAEKSTEVFAVDQAGNMNDVGGDPNSTPVLAIPAAAVSFTGRGRRFGDDLGFQGLENVADSLRLTRDFTVRSILQYKTGNATIGDKGTIVARGLTGSAAERLLFAVELEKIDAVTVRVRARWEEIGGAEAVGIAGADFIPDPDEFFALGVVRRWIDTTTVELCYVVNDIEIGKETVAAGDIGEGAGGTLTIGCVGDGAGNYDRFLPEDSIVDSISIESDAMPFEEIRQEFRRITVYQPDGYRVLRAYFPPGESWNKDPSSSIQRWIASEGDALGYALAQAAKLREDHLPDRAYGEALVAWEELVGITAAPLATIEERRVDVIAALRRILGFTIEDIKGQLEPQFGLDSADIVITEFSGSRLDDFSVDDITPAEPSNLWRDIPGNGSLAIAAGVCAANIPGATPNCQWGKDPTGAGGGAPPYRETSVAGLLQQDPDFSSILIDVDATVGVDGLSALSGVFMRNPSGEAVFFGALDTGLGFRLQSFSIVGGVRSAPVDHGVGGAGVDRLYLRSLGGGLFEVGRIVGGAVEILSATVAGPSGVRWAGFGSFSLLDASPQQDADFDNAAIFEPETPRGFAFIAYRDDALPGAYSIEKAQQTLEKHSPAHTSPLATDKDPFFFELGDDGKLGLDFLFPRAPTP